MRGGNFLGCPKVLSVLLVLSLEVSDPREVLEGRVVVVDQVRSILVNHGPARCVSTAGNGYQLDTCDSKYDTRSIQLQSTPGSSAGALPGQVQQLMGLTLVNN